MKVEWQVDDGYVGKDRPQFTEIDEDEFIWLDEIEGVMLYIEECIREDFEDRIGWDFRDYDGVKKQVEKILKEEDDE